MTAPLEAPLNAILILVFLCNVSRTPGERERAKKLERVGKVARKEGRKDCESKKSRLYYKGTGIYFLSSFCQTFKSLHWRIQSIFASKVLYEQMPLEIW